MMKPQIMNDERLIIKNLKNIQIVYALQTLGLIGILGYDFVTEGMYGITNNPLWLVFMASTLILAILSIRTDERLKLKNLQTVRVAYAVQIIGITCVLGYDFFKDGMNSLSGNPVWFVFIISTTILTFLSMRISVNHENNNDSAEKGFVVSIVTLLLICVGVGVFTAMSDGLTLFDGILTGTVFLICGFIPFLFLYNLRRDRDESHVN